MKEKVEISDASELYSQLVEALYYHLVDRVGFRARTGPNRYRQENVWNSFDEAVALVVSSATEEYGKNRFAEPLARNSRFQVLGTQKCAEVMNDAMRSLDFLVGTATLIRNASPHRAVAIAKAVEGVLGMRVVR
ncbi:MAG: hypothetical protein COV10_03100 [Candidatus Vogelbacteria bacterium CG10_big_fil_rev_8_21_14_0_10_51_16]|uniref:Uncharacterized protein n=1 Tax=Candidatus Vogelbacteria bacterium CG10_big_fil_rev_8_21_14_0_10_51_16 TaxID=1975045 RepID=A0A2H0REN1_9BACT|nr:MAG: hypothetical protein COV10_03100 [Candidatus Vogelbacteria bacterium CG10_big_fil_rev_8_21_14_0_10_51_16]